MSREARVFAEGSLRWVQASGTGGWNTASAPISALVGFVQVGQSFNSAANMAVVMERGVPHHHKKLGAAPIDLTFTYLQAVTGNIPNPATASGVSTKQIHVEIRITDDEAPNVTAQYFEFLNGVRIGQAWTEAEPGDNFKETWRFLSMVGPTASGYLS